MRIVSAGQMSSKMAIILPPIARAADMRQALRRVNAVRVSSRGVRLHAEPSESMLCTTERPQVGATLGAAPSEPRSRFAAHEPRGTCFCVSAYIFLCRMHAIVSMLQA